MNDPMRWSSQWKTWLLSAAFWLGIGTVFCVQNYYAFDEVRARSLSRLAYDTLMTWLPVALLTPPVFDLCTLFPLGIARRRNLIVMVAGGLAFVLLHPLLRLGLSNVFDFEPGSLSEYPTSVASNWSFLLFRYGTILGVAQAVAYGRSLRERDREAAELRREVVEAQLAALKMQLQPHFLFNTLQAISVFARRDPDEAARMIALLGDLLRRTLDDRSRQVVPLREELDFLRIYLEIQRVRFQDRMKVDFAVADDTLDCLVPNLVLQPLAENAVRHGIESRAGVGTIEIRAERSGEWLTLGVIDDGEGVKNSSNTFAREGVGLGNTRERLRKLYGDAQELKLTPSPTGGVAATVRLKVAVGMAEQGS